MTALDALRTPESGNLVMNGNISAQHRENICSLVI
jgi:hypothetical protein